MESKCVWCKDATAFCHNKDNFLGVRLHLDEGCTHITMKTFIFKCISQEYEVVY